MKKQAFTLAETIMTLFIVGLVVTAAIPSMTTKSLSDNSKLKAFCEDNANTNNPKCEAYNNSKKPFIPCSGSDTSCLYSEYPLTVPVANNALGPYQFNGNNVDFSLATANNDQDLWNYIHPASKKLFQVGSYFYEENDSSLYITNNKKTPSGLNNTVIGALANGADDNIQGTITNNTVIGRNNLSDNQNKTNNIIIGTNNTIASTANVQDSIVFGDNNTVNNNRSIVIGSNNQTIADNSLLIGSKINQPVNPGDPQGNRVFAIGDNMYIDNGDPDTLILDGDLEIHNDTFNNLTFNLTSDLRLKNIKGSYNKGLKEILQLKPVAFYYNGDKNKKVQVGVIAQEVQQIFPEAVSKMPNGYLGVDDSPMFFASINALKELDTKILTEEKRQENLNAELNKIERELLELTTCRSNSIYDKIKCFIMRKIFDWRGM